MKTQSILLLATGAVLPSISAVAAKNEKPNILYICIDDLRSQLNCQGHDYMITPNLDALAKDGRLFTRHYVQVPSSGASRACMVTGMPLANSTETNHGTLGKKLFGKPEPKAPESFIHHLKRNGYYTVGTGKVSHSSNGWRRLGKETALELPHSWSKFIDDPNKTWSDALHGYADGVERAKGKLNPAMEFLDREDESYPDGMLANLALAELDNLSKMKDPFFFAVGFYKPHMPFCAPKKYWDMYENVDIPLAVNPEVPKGANMNFIGSGGEFFNTYNHPEGFVKPPHGTRIDDDYAKLCRRAYFASLTYTDTQIGKLIDKMKKLGIYDNTIIVVWGDHGWHLGEQSSWSKFTGFDICLSTPLIVKAPEVKQKGKSTDALVASIDIYPTFCDLAGIPIPESVQGKSFMPALKNPKAETRDQVMSYWNDMLSMRTDRYRFMLRIKNGKQTVMLYDHVNDPHETVNIAAENPEVVKELTELMRENNNGYLPEL